MVHAYKGYLIFHHCPGRPVTGALAGHRRKPARHSRARAMMNRPGCYRFVWIYPWGR